MNVVVVKKIVVVENPSYFTKPFLFEINFDCIQNLNSGM